MKYSIYTSCFNIIKNNFNYWEFTIPKWLDFLENGEKGEIVICINSSEDDTLKIIKDRFSSNNAIKIIESNFDYTDYAFDGKIKNQALQNCKNEICLGLDLDEYLSPNKASWDNISKQFIKSPYDAVFLPSIDICKDLNYYKSIGAKWYMHKSGLHRGVWEKAKLSNGKIDIKKSDTCELLDENNELCKAIFLVNENSISNIKEYNLPFIIHLGWLNWENREKQNQTWQPIWSNRAGYKVDDIILEKDKFEKIEVFKHNLPI
jgi:hypothetical protein